MISLESEDSKGTSNLDSTGTENDSATVEKQNSKLLRIKLSEKRHLKATLKAQ